MIIDGIVHVFLGVVSSIISVFPSIPAIDPSIVTAGNWITTTVGEGSAFAQFLYGTTLLDALIAIAVAIWAFEPIYHGVMWVIHKIPFLNVH
jgi:hypothetical protein